MIYVIAMVVFVGICIELYELIHRDPVRRRLALECLASLRNDKDETADEDKEPTKKTPDLAAKTCFLSIADLSCMVMLIYLLFLKPFTIPCAIVLGLSIINVISKRDGKMHAWVYVDRVCSLTAYVYILVQLVLVNVK